MKRKLISALLISLLIVSVSGCGDDDKYNSAAEKIENMSDDEIENAILNGASKLN